MSFQKVMIGGFLGQDPEVKYMPSGTAVCNISVATDESYKDKSTGEKVEKTEWHRVVLFGNRAESVGKYFKKGSPIVIEGKLQTRKWEKDGVERYSTEIVCDQFNFFGSTGVGNNNQTQTSAPPPASEPPQDFDDDIPF